MAGRPPAAPSRCTCPAGNRVLAPAFQVVRRPVVQMVGSRHSSLSDPSTTVRAAPVRWWPWGAVTIPAGQPSSQASTSGVIRSGIDHTPAGAAGSGATWLANWMVRSTSWEPTGSRERMRTSFGWTPALGVPYVRQG
jgi:hypothetical protein